MGVAMDKLLRDKKMIAIFVGPAIILFVLFLLVPIIIACGLSLFSWDALSLPKFVGLNQYIRMFTLDTTFIVALKNTLFFLVTSLISQSLLGLIIAIALTNLPKFSNVFKNIFYMPAVLSSAAVGLTWACIFNPTMGALNNLLKALGLANLQHLWLVDPKSAMWCIAFVCLWEFTGSTMILYMAAIQGIPGSLYEASYIDGASKIRCIWNITLPLIKPMIKTSIILNSIGSLKFFDLIYTMTYGGPNHQTEVIASHLYHRSFQMFEYGYGDALSVILLILCVLTTLIVNKCIKTENYEM